MRRYVTQLSQDRDANAHADAVATAGDLLFVLKSVGDARFFLPQVYVRDYHFITSQEYFAVITNAGNGPFTS
jgi:hypothetical protein